MHLSFGQVLVNMSLTLLLMAVALVTVGAVAVLFFRRIERLIFPDTSIEDQLNAGNAAWGAFVGRAAMGLLIALGLIASRAVGAPLDEYDDAFRQQAHLQFGYVADWRLFKAQGLTESRLDPLACSAAGACGIMQLMPGTAVGMGIQDRLDARQSIRAGIAYDRRLYVQFDDPRPLDDRFAVTFAAYNWGAGHVIRQALPCSVERFGEARLWTEISSCLPSETRNYVPRIRAWLARLVRGGI